jgi:signal transduction histidine kinase
MESLFWQLTNRTAETQFIFNLFHLLLAGLTLLVLLHQLKATRGEAIGMHGWLLPLGFSLLVLHFAVLTLHFGTEFFFRKAVVWRGFGGLSHGFMACGLLLVVAALLEDRRKQDPRLAGWLRKGCALAAVLVLVDMFFPSQEASGEPLHSIPTLSLDLLALFAVTFGMRAANRAEEEGSRANLVALASVGIALVVHGTLLFLPQKMGILLWNAEQHALSVSLFAFAWAAGERSRNLLDRVFVRLNLTFLILASLIMLVTVGMEKYQYLRLAEERSMNLAEFLRGHTVYYRDHGESLEEIFRHTEVLKRVVVEFGTLPELREVDISLDGRRMSFHYTPEWEIKEEIVPLLQRDPPEAKAEITHSFTMFRLPLESGFSSSGNQVEFVGTMDFINKYIGKYIILIYSLFTIMVGLATGIIGIIISDTDRRLRQQYVELQETHQRLAQAAKLASIGQLAGGMAHEINNPITSILSLASHLAKKENAPKLAPRQSKSLEVIAQQAERVSKIVGNLLTFARESHLELSRVEVGELLDTAITLVQYRLRDNAIVLRREITGNLPMILGDAGRLTEVFINVLNNAADAMPRGGTLIVRARPKSATDGGVRVEVKDTGSGIPSEHLARVFDPFFTTKDPGRGTGLGLSISHGIIKDHGGEIWAESQPGAGATLVITLPGGSECS